MCPAVERNSALGEKLVMLFYFAPQINHQFFLKSVVSNLINLYAKTKNKN